MGDNRAMEYMRGRRILEINPDSPVIAQLKRTFEAAPAGPAVSQTVELLYETALLTSGFAVDSPKEFAARIYSLMSGGVAGDSRSSNGSQQSSPEREEVTPEVLAGNGDNGDDPWRK